MNVKNVNKKMLAGIMAVPFSFSVDGCDSNLSYLETSDGVYQLSNSIDFYEQKTCQIFEMKNATEKAKVKE